LANTAVISVLLSRILPWDDPLWRLFLAVVAGWTLVLLAAAHRMQRTRRVLASWLDHPAPDEAETRAAFAAATDVTREVVLNSFLFWPVGAGLVGLTLRLLT